MSENLPFRTSKMADSEDRKPDGDEEEEDEIEETVSLAVLITARLLSQKAGIQNRQRCDPVRH